MSAAPEPVSKSDKPQATAKSPFAGCIIMVVCVAVLVFLVGFSIWVLFRQADEFAKFTGEAPVTIPVMPVEGKDAEINKLAERLEAFRQSLDKEAPGKLELTPDDLNLAIATYSHLSELKSTFHVRSIREDGRVVLDVSLRINGKPRMTRSGEEGMVTSDPRYLNGALVVRPELAQGEIVLRVDEVLVPGAEVPKEFRELFSPYRITERYKSDSVLGPAMKKLTGVEVKDGLLVLRKTPGETAPGEISRDDVNSGVQRLLKWLGIVASVFLAFVGLILVIGLRAKRRKERAGE